MGMPLCQFAMLPWLQTRFRVQSETRRYSSPALRSGACTHLKQIFHALILLPVLEAADRHYGVVCGCHGGPLAISAGWRWERAMASTGAFRACARGFLEPRNTTCSALELICLRGPSATLTGVLETGVGGAAPAANPRLTRMPQGSGPALPGTACRHGHVKPPCLTWLFLP